MNVCACGCGTECKKEWAPGHNKRGRVPRIVDTPDTFEIVTERLSIKKVAFSPTDYADVVIQEGPPPYPAPIDHSRWTLAADRPGTPKENPWIKTICSNCRETMWARDPKATYEEGGICETCEWVMVEERTNEKIKRKQHAAAPRRSYDPFSGL